MVHMVVQVDRILEVVQDVMGGHDQEATQVDLV